MSQFREFEGEFEPVKKYSLQELHADKFILRLKREKQLNREIQVKIEPNLVHQPPSPPVSAKKRPRIVIVGTDALKHDLAEKKTATKRKRTLLVGTKALQEMLDQKRQKHAAKQRNLRQDTPNPRRHRRIKLIPFPSVERLDSEDDFVDASLEFHDLSDGELQKLKPAGDEQVSQIEVETSGSEQETLHFYETAKQDAAELSDDGSDSLELHTQENTPAFEQNENDTELSGNGNGGEIGEDNTEAENGQENAETPEIPESTNHSEQQEQSAETGDERADKNGDQTVNVLASDIDLMKLIIKPQILGLTFPLIEQSSIYEPYKEVLAVMEHTVRDREGQTVLLSGPRGSGKTFITEKAISVLREKYHHSFISIKLNALLHSDDKLALREIARQLDNHSRLVSGTDQSATFEQRAISDTLTNILLTLDTNAPGRHSDEVKESLVPVVIVIDEIEKFTGDGRQTLLYNLFDLSQSSKVPICVVGISTKVTTRELLEKRVKSRFSQRIISISRPSTIESFVENIRLNLIVPPADFPRFTNKEYPEQWNQRIESLLASQLALKRIIYKIYYTTKNYKDIYHCCQLPVSRITEGKPFPDENAFEVYLQQVSSNYAQSVVKSLSHVELLLAIAAARWVEKAEVPQVNFNLAYKEYTDMMKQLNTEATTLSSSSSFVESTILASIKVSQKIWSQKVMRDCWATLYKMGILFDVITSNNEINAKNNTNMYKNMVIEDSKMLQIDISLEELGSLIDDLTVLRKLTRL